MIKFCHSSYLEVKPEKKLNWFDLQNLRLKLSTFAKTFNFFYKKMLKSFTFFSFTKFSFTEICRPIKTEFTLKSGEIPTLEVKRIHPILMGWPKCWHHLIHLVDFFPRVFPVLQCHPSFINWLERERESAAWDWLSWSWRRERTRVFLGLWYKRGPRDPCRCVNVNGLPCHVHLPVFWTLMSRWANFLNFRTAVKYIRFR